MDFSYTLVKRGYSIHQYEVRGNWKQYKIDDIVNRIDPNNWGYSHYTCGDVLFLAIDID